MLAVLDPQRGAGPSCTAIVKPDNARLVPARKNHRADRSQEIMAVGVAHWQGCRRWCACLERHCVRIALGPPGSRWRGWRE